MSEIVRATESAPAPIDRRPLSPAARAAVAAGIPDSTRRAYNGDMARFLDWCAAEDLPGLPAAPETVTEYVTHLTTTPSARTGRPLAPSSIERAVAAIRTAHRAAGLPVPETKGARKALTGYRSRLSEADDPAARPDRAAPAVPTTLRAMVATLDRSTLLGQRDAALLLLGHAVAARSSELVALNISSVTVDPDGRGIAVRVYRKKIRTWQTPKVLYGSNPATCPVRAVLALLASLAAAGRTEGPLFPRIDRHGRIAPPMTRRNRKTGVVEPIGDPEGRLTAEAAADVVERTAAAAGVEGRWRGHSLRRGFVTAARAAGADLVDIGRHGGWTDGSKALLAYIEEDDGWSERNPLVGIGL